MKKLIMILMLFVSVIAMSQTHEESRLRVLGTLFSLPTGNDWRLQDAKDNYFEKWKEGVNDVKIVYTKEDTLMGESPGQFYPPNIIHINPTKFTLQNNAQVVIEHELYHAAFQSDVHIPGWMLWLGNKTDIGEPFNGVERVVMALTSRRVVLDYNKLPLNTLLTLQQIEDYLCSRVLIGLDAGFRILLNTTTPENLVLLLNFANGYEIQRPKTN